MKNKELKLYNKYKYKYEYIPNWEFIYIGKGNDLYWFIFKDIFKDKDYNLNVNILNDYGLNSEQIIKDLNLETYIDKYGLKRIKNYNWRCFKQENLINFKPLLKDKLKNIINR